MAISGLFLFMFVSLTVILTVDRYNANYKFCYLMDSDCSSLVLEATALPIEPQPLPEGERFRLLH